MCLWSEKLVGSKGIRVAGLYEKNVEAFTIRAILVACYGCHSHEIKSNIYMKGWRGRLTFGEDIIKGGDSVPSKLGTAVFRMIKMKKGCLR